MKKITIISDNNRIPNFLILPIKINKKRLKNFGYNVEICRSICEKYLDTDILCLNSSFFSTWWHQPQKLFEFIEKSKKYANKIVWLDDNDSTGVTHFELFPYIDLYLKKQLYADKEIYTKKLYGDRLFTDFYHREFGVIDEKEYQSQPLDMQYADKVQLSWHIGLGDMIGDILPEKLQKIKNLLPYRYPKKLVKTNINKKIDIMFRGTIKYNRNTVSYHREKIAEIIQGLNNIKIAHNGYVSLRRYKQETMDSKIVISPFGWGEIGVRDFEAWIYGAALMKPDMSHMVTWPDIFKPYVTYFPIDWGLNNIENGIQRLLNDKNFRLELAENGQNTYRRMTSKEGMSEFCQWFKKQIEK